jgi:hypothetical protein
MDLPSSMDRDAGRFVAASHHNVVRDSEAKLMDLQILQMSAEAGFESFGPRFT